MPYSIYPQASSSLNNYTQRFTSSTTWVAPSGCKLINIACVGGGGGGGFAGRDSAATSGGGGGAGGEVVRRQLAVTAGQSYQVVVGAGGAGGTVSSSSVYTIAQQGGYSSFNLGATVENIVLNGAAETSTNTNMLGAATNSATTNVFNTWASGYTNPSPATNQVSSISLAANSLPAISGITNGWVHSTSFSNSLPLHGVIATWVPISPSTEYTFSGYSIGRDANSFGNHAMRVDWYTSENGSAISNTATSPVYLGGAGSWNRFTLTATAPSNATYALLRFGYWHQNGAGAGQFVVTGIQVEPASSVSAYVGSNTAGTRYVSPLGFLSNITGVLAEGGGGGSSANSTVRYDGIGSGGGGCANFGTTYWWAGNGSGAGPVGSPFLQPIANTAITNIPFLTNSVPAVRGNQYISTGANSIGFNNATGGNGIPPNGAPATFDGFGAGGMGAINGFLSGSPGYGAGAPVAGTSGAGVSGLVNTGAGGGGGCATSTNVWSAGGNGGSGIVVISYLAE